MASLPSDFRWVKNDNKYTLVCNHRIGNYKSSWITNHVGVVKPTNDGRWRWWVLANKINPILSNKLYQGCCIKLEEAKESVEVSVNVSKDSSDIIGDKERTVI